MVGFHSEVRHPVLVVLQKGEEAACAEVGEGARGRAAVTERFHKGFDEALVGA